jgi:quinoprotein glucose dehydrogenase
MRRTLYRYRYLVLVVVLAAIVGQITFGYAAATSRIDVSGGGVADWPQYGRDREGTRYSPLDQVNRGNVAYLRKAWEYHSGDFSDGSDGRPETTFQATPILVDGVLYLATVYGRVIALKPETGAEVWTYDPGVDATVSTPTGDRDLHGCWAACCR